MPNDYCCREIITVAMPMEHETVDRPIAQTISWLALRRARNPFLHR
jgi:hypothetical protein